MIANINEDERDFSCEKPKLKPKMNVIFPAKKS